MAAVVMLAPDNGLKGLTYAQDLRVPYLSIGNGLVEVGPELALFAHRATAAPVILASHWLGGAPQSPDDEQRHIQWAQNISQALAPYAIKGGYISLLDEQEQERVPLAFGSNYDRLLDLKRKYDPDDVFRSTVGHLVSKRNHEIQPHCYRATATSPECP